MPAAKVRSLAGRGRRLSLASAARKTTHRCVSLSRRGPPRLPLLEHALDPLVVAQEHVEQRAVDGEGLQEPEHVGLEVWGGPGTR